MTKQPHKNPFTPRLDAEPPVMVGRAYALDDFDRLLRGVGKPLLIYGLRGYGKTVLLNHMRDLARAYESKDTPRRWAVSSRADQMITEGLDFERKAEIIAADLMEKINPGSKALQGMLKFAGSIEQVGPVKRKISDPKAAASMHQHIIDLFVKVVEEASSCDAGVLLVFDELQAMDRISLSALLTALSVAPGKNEHFAMVAAGLPSVRAQCNAAFNSFDKLFEHPELKALQKAEAETALRVPAAATGKPFTPEALERTLKLTHGYPYFVQFYGFWLWEDAAGDEITGSDIDRQKPSIGERLLSTFYEPKWEGCKKPARRYLSAMASLDGEAIPNSKVIKVMEVRSGDTYVARAELLRDGLIYETDSDDLAGDEIAFAFAYPYLRDFLRKKHPFKGAGGQ